MDWLVTEFGRELLLRPVALPDDIIPAGYDGSQTAATELCGRVGERMDLAPEQCGLSFELVGDGVRRPTYRGSTSVVKEPCPKRWRTTPCFAANFVRPGTATWIRRSDAACGTTSPSYTAKSCRSHHAPPRSIDSLPGPDRWSIRSNDVMVWWSAPNSVASSSARRSSAGEA